MVGAALTLPDINQVMAKMNGRLLPFGWLRSSCSASARSTGCGSSRSASSTSTSHTGVAAGALRRAHRDGGAAAADHGGEMGWILETNEPMNRAMEGMGGKIVKKYRVYERAARWGDPSAALESPRWTSCT